MQRTRSPIRPGIIPSLVLGALLVAWLPALAQNQPQTEPQNQLENQQQTPPAAQSFSPEQIEAFAGAAVEVQRVKTDFDAKAQGVDNQQDLVRLHQEAEAAAIQAVEATGLSPEEYGAIIQAANQDPQLYAMIVDLMQQRSTQ